MSDVFRLLTLQDANTRVVLLGVMLLGLASGVVGSFAVLRRRALVGDAVAHAALPGVCIAFMIIGDRNFIAFLIGALISGILAVVCITLLRRYTRVREDASIAVILTAFFGLGIALSRHIQQGGQYSGAGSRAGLDGFLLGKAASMVRQDVLAIALVALVVLLTVWVLYKELKLLCFDRAFAASLGRPVIGLDLLLMLLICLCTVIGLPAVGVVLMVSLLIVPGAAARFWTNRLSTMLVLGAAFGAFAGVLGAGVSAVAPRLSAGPLIALAAAAVFALSALLAPQSGFVWNSVRRRRLRSTTLVQNYLRALLELDEQRAAGVHSNAQLALKRAWSRVQLARAGRIASHAGWVAVSDAGATLTPAGQREAARVLRTHRLWELYLITHADVAPDHVDRDADALEHILSPEIVADLERRLIETGRLPALVPSPHPMGPTSAEAHA